MDQGSLYTKVPALRKARVFRNQLRIFHEYLRVCRAGAALDEMLGVPSHLTEPDLYSLDELERVKEGSYNARLQTLVDACTEHVAACPLCIAKGHVCEVCTPRKSSDEEVIFPFDPKTTQCPTCR